MSIAMPEFMAQQARLDEIVATCDELVASARELSNRLVALYGQQQADSEDHVLRIAGRLCLEFGHRDLWELIYRAAREGCQIKRGDEMAFLLRRPLEHSAARKAAD